jgi:hypothetical protein
MNVRTTLVGAAVASAFFALAAPAQSEATVRCKPGEYGEYTTGVPRVTRLRAAGLPRLTSGYAPRCLVADTAAGRAVMRPYNLPKTIRLYGARWDAGRWNVSSRFNSERYFTSVRFTQRHKSITFRFTEPRD